MYSGVAFFPDDSSLIFLPKLSGKRYVLLLKVTFSHPRSSDHLFFHVNPITGMTMRSEHNHERLTDETLIDPDHIVVPGIGASVEIPDGGYILDIAVFYDTSMVEQYPDDVVER